MSETNSRILNLTEASARLGFSKNTLRLWTNEGILPSIRMGKRRDRRFREEDIIDFLTKHTHKALEEKSELQ